MKNLLTILLLVFSAPLFGQDITNINPDNANDGATLDVTISGAGTNFTQATNTIISFYFDVGTSTVTNPNYFTVDDDQNITANLTVPAGTYQGYYGFTVYNDVDGCMAAPESFLVNGPAMPEITNISPNSGSPGNTYNVQLTGVNTNFTQSVNNEVYFMFSQATNTITMGTNVVVLDDENLTTDITVPAGAYGGDYDVIVYSDYDGYLWHPESFTVNGPPAPSIVGVSPNQGLAGNTYTIVVTGNNTTFTQGFNNATFFTSSTNTCFIGSRAESNYATSFLEKDYASVAVEPNFINVISDEIMEVNVTFPSDIETGPVKFDLYNSQQGYIYNPFEFLITGYSNVISHQPIQGLKVYPNPFNDEIQVEIESDISQSVKMELLSASGKVLTTSNFDAVTGNNQFTLKTDVASGVYLLKVTQEDGNTQLERVIKK